MSNLKKDTLGKASARSLTEAFRCGECLHHKKHPHPSMQEPCTQKGIRSFAIAPTCFTPDVTQVANNTDTFVQLAALFSDYSPRQKRILLGLLRQATKKQELAFGTKVYFRGIGKDYLSNYLAGFVMGTTSSGELIISGSPEQNTRGRSYLAYIEDTSTLMTAKEWRVKKAELKAAGRILDPTISKLRRSSTKDNEEPPTIDQANEAWYAKQDSSRRKRRTTDMVTVISR